MKQNDVIIIGGGAAGLTAALSASMLGTRCLVLEGAPRMGRKILASGNGRCNLANMGRAEYFGAGDANRFAFTVLQQHPVEDVLQFFRGLGLVTMEEDGGRVYPACGQAAAVLDVLRSGLDRQGVQVLCDSAVSRIEPTKWGFRVHAPQGIHEARAVVAACGGMAGGKLGHDGGAYRLLTDLGHTLVPARPALTPLTAEKSAVKGLSGLRVPAILTLCRKKEGVFAKNPLDRDEPVAMPRQGEALFTDYGVSGICAMQLARWAWAEYDRTGVWPVLYLDFSPLLGLAHRCFGQTEAWRPEERRRAAEALLRERAHILPADGLLTGLLPRLLADRLRGQGIPDLARSLTAYPVPLTGVRPLENAQVTAGGIDTAEFSGFTLESSLVPGLFAAGEMLDVDGDCGGFNLLFAFSSGLTAGESAARAALRL